MGIEHGMFFEKEKTDDITIEDTSFLSRLTNVPINELQTNTDKKNAIQNLCKRAVVIPSYFKSPEAFLFFLFTFLKSPLCAEESKKKIVFFTYIYYLKEEKQLGDKNISLDNVDFLLALYEAKIGKVTLINGENIEIANLHKKLIARGINAKRGITEHEAMQYKEMTIINERVSPLDFKAMYAIGQLSGALIAAGSGDVSTAILILFKFFPFLEIRDYKCKKLIAEIKRVFPQTFLEKLVDLTCVPSCSKDKKPILIYDRCWPSNEEEGLPAIQLLNLRELIILASQLAPFVNKEMLINGQRAMEEVRRKNLFDILPGRFDKDFQLAFDYPAPLVLIANHHAATFTQPPQTTISPDGPMLSRGLT